jgi:hypothetical protein
MESSDGYELWRGQKKTNRGVYRGTMIEMDDLPHGYGRMLYHSGEQYVGGFSRGLRTGIGVLKKPHSSEGSLAVKIQAGEWKSDMLTGQGIMFYHNGDHFRGYVRNNLPHGKGIYHYKEGNIYEGDFFEGEQHGFGAMTYKNGELYLGMWKHGRYHGFGTYRFSNGDRYQGQFLDNMHHGVGVMLYANGNIVVGHWKEDELTGFTVMTMPNGSHFRGYFEGSLGKGKLFDSSCARTVQAKLIDDDVATFEFSVLNEDCKSVHSENFGSSSSSLANLSWMSDLTSSFFDDILKMALGKKEPLVEDERVLEATRAIDLEDTDGEDADEEEEGSVESELKNFIVDDDDEIEEGDESDRDSKQIDLKEIADEHVASDDEIMSLGKPAVTSESNASSKSSIRRRRRLIVEESDSDESLPSDEGEEESSSDKPQTGDEADTREDLNVMDFAGEIVEDQVNSNVHSDYEVYVEMMNEIKEIDQRIETRTCPSPILDMNKALMDLAEDASEHHEALSPSLSISQEPEKKKYHKKKMEQKSKKDPILEEMDPNVIAVDLFLSSTSPVQSKGKSKSAKKRKSSHETPSHSASPSPTKKSKKKRSPESESEGHVVAQQVFVHRCR